MSKRIVTQVIMKTTAFTFITNKQQMQFIYFVHLDIYSAFFHTKTFTSEYKVSVFIHLYTKTLVIALSSALLTLKVVKNKILSFTYKRIFFKVN